MRIYPEPLRDVQLPQGWTQDQLLDFMHKLMARLNMSNRGQGYKSYEAMDAMRLFDQILTQEPYEPRLVGFIGGRGPTIPPKGAFCRWLHATFRPDHPLWLWLPDGHRPTQE